MRDDLIAQLSVILADTYALYLKTQNYHWHVTGPQFKTLHELFEEQYRELAEAVDSIAEQLRIMGALAPATFKALDGLKTLKDGDAKASANQMVTSLAEDNNTLVEDINRALKLAEEIHDEGATNLLSDRVSAHEKARWMLSVSQEKQGVLTIIHQLLLDAAVKPQHVGGGGKCQQALETILFFLAFECFSRSWQEYT